MKGEPWILEDVILYYYYPNWMTLDLHIKMFWCSHSILQALHQLLGSSTTVTNVFAHRIWVIAWVTNCCSQVLLI